MLIRNRSEKTRSDRLRYESQLLAAALFVLSASTPLMAADVTSKTTASSSVKASPDAMDAHEHGGPEGHHGHMPPLMHELHQLDLTDAQKQTIHGFFESKRETIHSQMEAVHQARQAFDAAEPGTAAFVNAQAQLETVEIAATQSRIRNDAELKTKIYSVLTDAQKTKLQQLIAQRPSELPPPPVD